MGRSQYTTNLIERNPLVRRIVYRVRTWLAGDAKWDGPGVGGLVQEGSPRSK